MLAAYGRPSPSTEIVLSMRQVTRNMDVQAIRASLLRLQRQGTTVNMQQADDEETSDNDDMPRLVTADMAN